MARQDLGYKQFIIYLFVFISLSIDLWPIFIKLIFSIQPFKQEED